MISTMRRAANHDGAVTRNVPRGTPLTDPTASSASSSSSRMTLHRSKYSLPDSVRLRCRLLRLSRRDPKCFSRNIRCLLVIAVERFNRSAAPTKLPDSTTCRNTFMLTRVSIPDMVYLASENQPEGTIPFGCKKNGRGQDGRLRSFRADNASAHNIVVHVRTLFGGDGSNNPHFIYAAFHFSKRRLAPDHIQSFDTSYRKICATNFEVTG